MQAPNSCRPAQPSASPELVPAKATSASHYEVTRRTWGHLNLAGAASSSKRHSARARALKLMGHHKHQHHKVSRIKSPQAAKSSLIRGPRVASAVLEEDSSLRADREEEELVASGGGGKDVGPVLALLALATLKQTAILIPASSSDDDDDDSSEDAMGKKSITTSLKENFLTTKSQPLQWQTKLVEDKEEAKLGDGQVEEVGLVTNSAKQSDLSRANLKHPSSRPAPSCEDYKSHLLACATAAMTANLAAVAAASALPSLEDGGAYGGYQRAFFNQPTMSGNKREPLHGRPTLTTFSSAAAAASESTTIERQADKKGGSLLCGKLRNLSERNLLASFVGLYILVALSVILFLVLPWLLNSMNAPTRLEIVGPALGDQQQQRLTMQSSMRTDRATEPDTWTPPTGDDGDLKPPEEILEEKVESPPVASTEDTKRTEHQAKYLSMWNATYSEPCQPMQVPFCGRSLESMLQQGSSSSSQRQHHHQQQHQQPNNRLMYDATLVPNQFHRLHQSEVQIRLAPYESVVDIKCFALTPLFLCSIFAPKCVPINQASSSSPPPPPPPSSWAAGNKRRPKSAGTKGGGGSRSRLVPPCRSLCKEVIRRCLFFFEVLSLPLFQEADCELLPESTDSNICVGKRELNWIQKVEANKEVCPESSFRCSDGNCIPKKYRCDGFFDCNDRSDEHGCSRCNAHTQFYCGQDKCIRKEQVCNGISECRDGRDERQCLRLARPAEDADDADGHEEEAKRTRSRAGGSGKLGRLEVWSATKEEWTPVCGSHWSPMRMSHEACQALGYSRANETLILYGGSPPPTNRSARSETTEAAATDRVTKPAATVTASARRQPRVAHYSDISGGNGESVNSDNEAAYMTAAWSGLTSVGGGSSGHTDGGEHMADILEVASAEHQAMLAGARAQLRAADHVISYETSDGRRLAAAPSATAAATRPKAPLNSLVTMLYQGTGCAPGVEPSVVHLRCQNFQCGRPTTSYSNRVRKQLILQAHTKPKRDGPLGRSALATTADSSSNDSLEANKRSQMLVAEEELEPEEEEEESEVSTVATSEEDGSEELDNSTLPLDALLKGQVVSPKLDQQVASRLVVGGIESMPGEFPYLAALHGGPDEVFFCGGVLISFNWLLTAAHCVGNRSRPDGWTVKVGVTRRIASHPYVKKLSVRRIIKHPGFNQSTFENDIALILLEEEVEFNQYLRPICLPEANIKLGPRNSNDCVVVGFGKSKFGQDSNYLHVAHFVNLPIVEQSVCSGWYKQHEVTLGDGMLCAGYAEGKRDACQGDSGSGLFCRYSNTNQFYVAGVVSFGIKCGNEKLPGVYTSVPSYVDWIKSTTREHGYMVA